MIDIKSFSKPKKSGNGSGGGSSSVTYISGIASEADHATRADKAKKAEVAEQANVANRATSAQTASYASKAGEVDIESETLQKFFRKDVPAEGEENVAEKVHRKVDFKKAATFEEAADMLKGFTAHELAAFLKGFTIAGQFGIDEYGDMILNTIKSLKYNNAAEQGFSVEKEKNGKYHAFVTNLTIWGKAIFHELEVRKLSYSGGNIYLSGAGSKLVKVIPVKKSVSDGVTSWVETTADDTECVGWKCYLLADNGTTATMNYWQEGDQVRCQTIGEITAGGTYQDASNKSYWRTIPNGGVSTQNEKIYGTMTETYLDEAGKEQTREVQVELYGGQSFAWIVVGKHSEDLDGYTDEDSAPTETRGIPADGDTIVLDGNRHRNEHGEYDKTDRQNVIVLETTGEYAPRIACYANISEYKHTITKSVNGEDKEVSLSVFETSPKGGTKINSSRFEWISNDGSTINIINYRGDWVKGNTYHKNDQVNHNNAVWVCVANSEESVIAEPSDSSTQWKKVLYGGKGEKGDDAVIYTLESSPSYIRLNSDGSIDYTNGYIDKGDEYESEEYLVVRGYKVVKGVRDNRFSTESSPVTLRLTINDGSAYSEYTPSDGDSVSIDFEPKYEDSYYSMLQEISNSGLNSVRVDMCEGSEYNTNKILATCDIPIIRNGKDGQKGDQGDKGEDGVDGTDGKDAVSVLVENAPLVFDTNDDGIVSPDISKIAKVKIMRGNRNVSDECSDVYSRDDMCVNCKCGVTQENGYISVSISSNNITKNDVIVDGVSHGKVSATSGYAVAQATYDGVTHFVQVPFSVNVAKFTGVVAFDNNGYKSQFEKVTNRLNDTATKDDLKKAESDFKQTAREISLTVSEKAIARRNLLVGSAFLREDNNFGLFSDARIEMNSGYQGTNCIKCIDDTTDGKTRYPGVFWDASLGGKSVRITKGKKYVISCWYFSNNANGHLSLEALYIDKRTNERKGAPKYLSAGNLSPKPNQWQLFSTVIDTTDAEYDYIAFNFYEHCGVESGLIEAYICRPMVEEGDTYNGWTLSQDDYDIIGANLIDNSRTLDVGGNVLEVKGQKALVGDAYELTYIGSDDYNSFYRIKGSTFQLGVDYTISFEVRGDAEYMGVYAYYPITNTKFTLYAEPQNGAMTEVTDGGKVNNYVALIQVKELSKQQRVWSHFRFKDRLPEQIYFQFPKNAQQTGVTSWSVTITKPKIEVGAVVTEYTERKSDLVDKASLKKAGIEVKSDEVLLHGDRIRVNNNGQTAALFTGGKINASLIDADKIEVKHLWAKSNDGASKVGYFGNTEEEACKIDDTYAPLFVGADTAKNSPFYVTNKGHMVSKSATLGSFSLNESSLRYLTGYDDEEPGFALYNEYMVFRGYSRTFSPQTKKWTSERNRLIWVGRNDWVYSVPSLMSNILVQDSFPMTTGDTAKIGLRISVTGCDDKYQYENVMYNGAMGSNVYGNFAIYAENGMYAGFRPMTRRANYSMELTKLDCVIYVPVTGITLTLPDNPQRGQYYKFIQGSEGKQAFWIKSNSYKMYWNGVDTNGRTSFVSGACNQTTEFIFLGDHWRVNWYREAAI